MAESESGQERTEDATEERKRKARVEGQVVRSRELISVALVASGAVGLFVFTPAALRVIQEASRALFEATSDIDVAPERLIVIAINESVGAMAWALGPFMLLVLVVGVGASLLVGGWNFSVQALTPKLERLDPIKGLGRMFSMRSLVELVKSILKFLFISAVAVAVLYASVEWLMTLVFFDVAQAMTAGVTLIAWALLAYAAALAVVAAIDLPFQIAQHNKQLKMTRQEVKDELKNSEGRPEVKARIRRLQQELANREMLGDVPEATVVLTNPEHYAVALRYDENLAAPVVCARGVDQMALRIREVAQAHSVEILRLPPLARAIYHNSKLGDEIPLDLYVPVAQVLAYIAQLNDYRAGRLATPPTLGPVTVPGDLASE